MKHSGIGHHFPARAHPKLYHGIDFADALLFQAQRIRQTLGRSRSNWTWRRSTRPQKQVDRELAGLPGTAQRICGMAGALADADQHRPTALKKGKWLYLALAGSVK
jgi:hypothetical protein